MTRPALINAILDRLARTLADDMHDHALTEREVYLIAANLAGEAIHYAAKREAAE